MLLYTRSFRADLDGGFMDSRKVKATELADRGRAVRQADGTWLVYSLTSAERYKVRVKELSRICSCTCPDFELRLEPCKHIQAVRITIARENYDRRTGAEPRPVPEGEPVKYPKKTYQQDWPAYDLAQT